MIGVVHGRAGEPVFFEGHADDFDRSVAAVEFSLNNGETWTTYPTPNTDAERLLRWRFEFIPEIPGNYQMLVRSQNDQGQVSPQAACVSIHVEA